MFTKKINVIWYGIVAILLSPSLTLAETIRIDFAYIGPQEHSALIGIKQGLAEANLQGQFLNQEYRLEVISKEAFSTHGNAKYLAIMTAVDLETFLDLTEQLPNTPLFNLSISDDNLRVACIGNALHIIPSNRMKADAKAQWRQKTDKTATAFAWHPDFKKFAARDLNKRFEKNHHLPMDDYAWAGWAAVKMTSDSVARTSISNPEDMLNYLKTELSFDGQKGKGLNFRETGQLRQLLLLIEGDKIVAEAPVRGVAIPPELDSLGIKSCEK